MTEGRKDDTGKLPWQLVPWDSVRAIVEVLKFGAGKYAPRNWELGMDWDRPFAACIRHLTAWWEREPADPETGFSHLWHAGCCIVFLIAYERRGVGKDSRPNAPVQVSEIKCQRCDRVGLNGHPECGACAPLRSLGIGPAGHQS